MEENNQTKKNYKSILIILLILVVIGLIFYYRFVPEYSQKIVQIGYDDGYSQAVGELFYLASQCQEVPITFNNQTISLIAIECLR